MMFVPNQLYYTYPVYNNVIPINTKSQLITENRSRSRFTKLEDELLKQLVESQQNPNWNEIAKQLKNRTARQCRERYNNYLRPNIINGQWTKEEDALLIDLFNKFGPKWALISQSFKSRSPVNIKNRHSTLISHLMVESRRNHQIENKKIVEAQNAQNQFNEISTTTTKVIQTEQQNQSNEHIDNDDMFDNSFPNYEFGGDDFIFDNSISLGGNDLLVF